jgi:hypothetical protein
MTLRVSVLAVGLSLACVSVGGAQTTPLTRVGTFDVGSPSGQVLLADVDEDGRLDLLTRHQQARAIRVFLGNGRASFTRRQEIAVSFAPADMELGDVNRDGDLDLVVTAGARDLVDVLLGGARTGFRRAVGSPFAAGDKRYQYNKRAIQLLDVDRDGFLDVVTTNRRGQYAFRVLLGNGRGRFAPGPVLTVEPAQEGYLLGFGDVDIDGDVDAVTALSSTEDGRLDVHLSDGRSGFEKAPASPLALPPTYSIEAVVDVNADRRPDLVLCHRDERVSILLNRGGGRFAHASGSPFRLSARPFSLALADINRDKRLDFVAATTDRVTVLIRGGRQVSFRAGPGAYNVAVGDLNGDRRPDVVASSFESSAVTVLLGR